MENWNLKNKVFENKNQTKYLIAAFYYNEPDDQILILSEVKEALK